MSDIPTWHERAMVHPDHQSGMISEDMILARMAEEVEDLRAEVERLRADLATQQGCCDGAAAQDAHIRREREEHRAQIERLRGAMRWYADLTNYVGPVISVFDPPPALLDKGALAREALEAKP